MQETHSDFSMKKILAAFGFFTGAVFGMLFSTKKGEDIRKEVKAKKNSDQKLEVVKNEAKALLTNFWNSIRGPLKRHFKDIKEEAEKYGKKYGHGASVTLGKWKEKAMNELEKEASFVKNSVKKGVKGAKNTVSKTVHVVRKKLR